MGYLTAREAARRLNVERSTAHKYINRGLLPAERKNGQYWITEEGLAECRRRLKERPGPGRPAQDHVVREMSPEERLSFWIIRQAIQDYRRMGPAKRYEIEKFFRSRWFGVLSLDAVDPEDLIDWLREEG